MRAVAFVLLLAAAPVAAEPGVAEVKKAAGSLIKALRPSLEDKSGKVGVLAFTPLVDGAPDAPFGPLVQEQVARELVERRKKAVYTVLERSEIFKLMEDSRVYGKDEDLFDKLREKGGLDYMVSGTYALAGDEITITASVIETKTGIVLAYANATFRAGKALAALVEPPKAAEKVLPPLSVETALVYLGTDGKLRPVREGTALTAQDNYALYLTPGQDCHVYVYQADSAGNVVRLFPNPDFGTGANPLLARRAYWLPNDKDYFFLDEKKGKETIYVVAARKARPELEALVTARREGFEEKVGALKLMGAGGRREIRVAKTPPLKGASADLLTRGLAADGDFLYTVSFAHQ